MYIKQVELSNFKSFGGKTPVPLLPGFTVISGPNGSGKSNILDALLFALGLSSSKGMRADRLPDLVNQAQMARGHSTIEASVSVTFDLEGANLEPDLEDLPEETSETVMPETPETQEVGSVQPTALPRNQVLVKSLASATELTITRKLRVTKQGAYTSNYYANGQPCNLAELHEQLQRLRIYPEGYNVVLQGDVTSIISMNPRERREIIDELAGVAQFDRKINQARAKLDEVKEQEEKFRIVEKELTAQRDRLAQDCVQARKYQKLRAEFQAKSQWEVVIQYRRLEHQHQQLQALVAHDRRAIADLSQQLDGFAAALQQSNTELVELNRQVKTMGEEEQLALQSQLATREAEVRQLERQQRDLNRASQNIASQLQQSQIEQHDIVQALAQLDQEQQQARGGLTVLQQQRDQAQQTLEQSREAAATIAHQSEAWVQQQSELYQRVETLRQQLEPRQRRQASLRERVHQLERQTVEQQSALQVMMSEIAALQQRAAELATQDHALRQQVQTEATKLAEVEQALQVQQQTCDRLQQEQREKQRRLDRLEAQTQALQESQGTGATRVILQMGIPGVLGLVAQLGRVDSRHQLALETAAGARLGNVVVEDDTVAATAIELLKQKGAGRATFLPLNKLNSSRHRANLGRLPGLIDYALNLVEFEPRYQDVFAHVFGTTVVFETLEHARRYLGQYRMVTLEGELLETSGAMTGGSRLVSSSLHFGGGEAPESAEVTALKQRLQDIEQVLSRCDREIQHLISASRQSQQKTGELRQQQREAELQHRQVVKELEILTRQQEQVQTQLAKNLGELTTAQQQHADLAGEIPALERPLQVAQQALAELEQSQTHSQWQQCQQIIRTQETHLQERELALRSAEQRLRDLETQQQRLQTTLSQAQERLAALRQQQASTLNQTTTLQQQETTLRSDMARLQAELARLDQRLAAVKESRDRLERQWREQQSAQQQADWQCQKARESLQQHQQELTELQAQLETQRADLPDPLPDIPPETTLEQLQQELRSLQKRIQAMEPVNMLALEEYDRTQERLQELSQKLTVLDEERMGLLLRIENFTTLRQKAFCEAFDAVNKNFQSIFAELSDGDGHLQLDNLEDPFNSGLNLVAHPKGKPVQRLASMSGGEKSLTALSFIFALQRYRPSPFYAFDEVDMFLDGANVERLAKMIRKQALQAQFIVVSLRRPMIESAERTIGVTQARGAYTQVLGINLQPQSAGV